MPKVWPVAWMRLISPYHNDFHHERRWQFHTLVFWGVARISRWWQSEAPDNCLVKHMRWFAINVSDVDDYFRKWGHSLRARLRGCASSKYISCRRRCAWPLCPMSNKIIPAPAYQSMLSGVPLCYFVLRAEANKFDAARNRPRLPLSVTIFRSCASLGITNCAEWAKLITHNACEKSSVYLR